MLFRLQRIIRHLKQFLVDWKAAFDTVKRQLTCVRKPTREMVLMRERPEGDVQPHKIPRNSLNIAARQTAFSLHRCSDLIEVASDPFKLPKIPPRDAGIFKLEVILGKVSFGQVVIPI
jgi:hypothetical protein